MLGILLMILKIIGIILLCILGLFLVLILLVLFVPIPYRIYMNGDSGDPKNLVFRIKIFGIQVFPKKEVSGNARRWRRKKRIKEPDSPVAETPQIQAEESKEETSKKIDTETAGTHQAAEQTKPQKQKQSKTSNKTSKRRTKNTSGTNVRETLQSFYAEFTSEGNRHALRHLILEIRYILRHFGPRRVRADVCFSLGDPANTGYATAALSMCPFSYGKNCHIIPDFEVEKWYVQGWLDMQGHVRTVHLIAAGLRLLFDRNVRAIIRKFLKKK